MAPSVSFPPSGSAAIETLDGSNWPTWSSRMIALFRMNGLKTHILDTKPASDKDWDAREEMVLGVLEMYCQKDVWMSVSDDSMFGTCKSKWEELQKLYGGIGCYDTTGSLVQQESGGACAILGMTLSCMDLVLGLWSGEKCSAMQGNSLVA